jgi:hypothetical protein
MSRLSRKCAILNFSQPYRPPQPVKGIALLYFYFITAKATTAFIKFIFVNYKRNPHESNV